MGERRRPVDQRDASFLGLRSFWAQEWAKEGREVDWQRLLPRRGFEVLPRRWVVERTF
jgi:hypothetical protein